MNNILDIKPGIIIGDNYKTELILPAWKGFQSRQGNYGSRDSVEQSNGFVKVFIDGKAIDHVRITTIEQVNAIQYLVEHAEQVRDALLKGLQNELPKLKESYDELVPDIDTLEEFKNYIGLAIVHVMPSDKDGFAYIGFELGCEWDIEHGAGVMMHKDRVIAIGQADTAFDSWITYADNGTIDDETEKWDKENAGVLAQWQKKENKKSWWKFW